MSNQGFIPVSIDLDTLETTPEMIQVRNAGAFTPEESARWNGMARLTNLNTFLMTDPDINNARNTFNALDPTIQKALIDFNPEAEYAKLDEKGFLNKFKKSFMETGIVRLFREPLPTLISAGQAYVSAVENTALNALEFSKKTREAGLSLFGGPEAVEKATNPDYWGEGWNAYNKWNEIETDKLDNFYNRATGVFVRGILDGKNQLEIFREYGAIDEDMVNIYSKFGTPEFDEIANRYSRQKINLGSKIVDWAGRFAPLKEKPTATDTLREAIAASVLSIGGIRNVARNEYGEFVTEKLFKPGQYGDPGVGLDIVALGVVDPLTYVTFGGSRGMALTASAKSAAELQNAANAAALIRSVEQLFTDPAYVTKNSNFINDLNVYRDALDKKDLTTAGAARVKISLDHPEYDDDGWLGLLVKSTVVKGDKEVPITDMDTFFEFFKSGQYVNSLVNGTVNNIITAREGVVALQKRQNLFVNNLRKYSAKIFQGLDTGVVIGAKPMPNEIVDTWVDFEKTILARPVLDVAGAPEEMLDVIVKNETLLKSLTRPKEYGIKNARRLFGELLTTMPASRGQIFWSDALVDKGLDNLRKYARLITGDRLRAEFITQLFKSSTRNERINIMYNLDKLYLQEIAGASATNKGVELTESILNSRYVGSELASVANYLEDVPDVFKNLDDVDTLPLGPSAFMHLTDGITLFDFDDILQKVYGSMGNPGTRAVSSTQFKYGPTTYKNIFKKLGYLWWTGSTNNEISRIINRGLVFLYLFPKLGVKTAVDEATVLANVSSPDLLANGIAGKGRALSTINIAIKGDTSFQGPVKSVLLDLFGKNPAKFAEAAQRKELTSMKMVEVPLRDPDTGKEIIQKELLTAEEFFGKPPEEILVDAAVAKYGKPLSPEEKQWFTEHYILEGDTVSDAMIGSVVGSTYGDSLAPATRLAKDIYGKSPLTTAFDSLGLKVLSKPYLIKANQLDEFERQFAQYSYFYKLFAKNDKYNVEPTRIFMNNNALKTEKDVEEFVRDMMGWFGWIEQPTAKSIAKAIKINDEFGQVQQLRAAGKTEEEISRIIIKNMAIEMRHIFHGGSGYNQALVDLLRKKASETVDKIDKAQRIADAKMLKRERAGVEEVISDAELARRQKYYREATAWKTIVGKLTWEEFEEATKGFVIKGAIKTDVGFEEVLKVAKEAGDIKSVATNAIASGFRLMDRTSNDLTRSDVYFLKILEERGKLKANQELYTDFLVSQGVDRENALVQSAAVMANQARHNAANTMLKYVDNPTLRSQLAFNMRIVGRFIRATEDFSKRTLRWMLKHPTSIPYRIGHTSHATDGSGITYTDDDNNTYVVIPNDGVFWQDIAPAIVMLGTPQGLVTLGKIGMGGLQGQSIKDSPYWGFFKQVEWNQYTSKLSILNPSLMEGSGVYTLLGPNIGLPVIGIRDFLVGRLAQSQESPELAQFGLSIDNILLGEISDDTTIWRSTIPPAINNFLKSLDGEYKDNQGAIAAYQAIAYMQYINPKKAEDFLNETGDVDPGKAQQFLNEWRIQVSNVLAQKAGFNTIYGAPLALGTPGISKYLRDNGTVTFTKEYGDILRAVLDYNQENGFFIKDPYATAVSLHALERPGKLIFQVPKNLRESKIAINYTMETYLWGVKNRKFVEQYPNASWIFAPNVGEYDPRVIAYMEAADMIPEGKNAFDDNNAALRSYIERTTVAKQLYQYYQYDKEVERLLNDPDNPRRNFVDYRTEIMRKADVEKEALKLSNPLLKHVLETQQVITTESLRTNFNELKTIVNQNLFPKEVGLDTRDLLKIMVRSASELLVVTENNAVARQYLGDTELRQQVETMYSEYQNIARQNPILGEAWTAIIKPMLDKTYDYPLQVVRKPGD
jgi:hypothetical protein